MAPFSISTHHSLPYRGCLTQENLFAKSKTSPELPSGKLRLSENLLNYSKTSIMKLKVGLWQIFRRVAICCTKVVELFRSKLLFFICVGKTMAMMGTLRKSEEEEGLERPGVKDQEMKVWMEDGDDDELESSVIESDDDDEEESHSERNLESDEETDEEKEEDDDEEVDSDWSDEKVDSDWSDEEDDSEASAESLEIWESFLNNGDPYNPLSFCSSTCSSANQNQLTNPCKTQTTPDTRTEEALLTTSSKKETKKVRFSDCVTVRPLVAWAFASRSARDGSCWLQMARDRERFKRRAQNTEAILKPCLSPEHRANVWEELQIT